ncbi:MAG: UbiA family prenyltransferase [Desulfomonilaceae bacterium]|nr:UbiA family prenyltransferase [Desulfomonilaceae bacterium]
MTESDARTSSEPQQRSPVTWKLFLGLSRTPHGVLDLATPAMAALLWLGHFPPTSIVIVGLITAFSGYTAVYALNDLVDHRVDKERLRVRDRSSRRFDVDEIMVPHPVAQGMLSFTSGLSWCLFWAALALVGAWWLNPVCAVLFVLSAALEAIYCKLLRITHLKIVASAAVKSIGGLAGVLAVDPHPSPGFAAVLMLWLAAWEVGGQNIPNDMVDMEEDAGVSARTTLTVKGVHEAVFRLVAAVSMAAACGTAVYWFAGDGIGMLYPVGAVLLGWKLLLEPARCVYHDPGTTSAETLFNRASYMPLCFLVLVVVSMYIRL